MAEPLYLRVRRVISATSEDAVDALERASGASVMREAIRQVERALQDLRAEQDAAVAGAAQAKTRQARIRERLADLEEKARFALAKGRDDLAEAALARQVDLEAETKRLRAFEADAARDARRLEENAAELVERHTEMERELAEFELGRGDNSVGDDQAAQRDQAIRRRADRARETFDRMMNSARGGPGHRIDAQEAEIDALRRGEAVAERLAALRAAAPPSGSRTGRAKRASS